MSFTSNKLLKKNQSSPPLVWIDPGTNFLYPENIFTNKILYDPSSDALFGPLSSNGGMLISYSDGYWFTADNLLPDGYNWDSIFYSNVNQRYVVTTLNGGNIAYSNTSSPFTGYTLVTSTIEVPPGGSLFLRDVVYGNGKFVALNYSGGFNPYSNDGINWVGSTIGRGVSFQSLSIAYGNGVFVVGSIATSQSIQYSLDGINYSNGTSFAPNFVFFQEKSIVYGNNIFVGVAALGTNVFSPLHLFLSPDGINWTATPSVNVPNCPSGKLFFANGRFIGNGGSVYSDDGFTWKTASLNGIGGGTCGYGRRKFHSLPEGFPFKPTYSQI
jgi:hypothetical protein